MAEAYGPTGRQRRQYYRVVYPRSLRPVIKIKRREYYVIDISEQGVKFQTQHPEEFVLEQHLAGEVYFTDGKTERVEGKVYRIEKNQVVLLLTVECVSIRTIRKEELRLIPFEKTRREYKR